MDLEILDGNPRFLQIAGRKWSDLAGKKVSLALPTMGKDFPVLLECCARVASTGITEEHDGYWETFRGHFRISFSSEEIGHICAFLENLEAETEKQRIQDSGKLGSFEYRHEDGRILCSRGIGLLFEVRNLEGIQTYAGFEAYIHPDDQDTLRTQLTRAVKDKENTEVTHRILTPKGKVKWVHTSIRSQYSAEGKPVSSMGVIQDITRQKEAELALAQSQEIYSVLTEHAFSAIYIVRIGEGFQYVNERFCELVGYGREEMLSPSFDMDILLAERSRKLFREQHERFRKGLPLGPQFEMDMVTRDGKILTVEVSLQPYPQDPGLCLGQLHDITQEKQIWKDLQQEKLITKTVFSSVPGILFLADEDLRLVWWNYRLESLVGLPGSELARTPVDIWFHKDPADPDRFLRNMKQVREKGNGEWESGFLMRSRNHLPMYLTVNRLQLEQGIHYIGTGLDISILKNTQRSVAESQEKLRIALLSVGDAFVSTDISGNIDMINTKAEQITGWTHKEAEGVPLPEVFQIIHENSGEIRSDLVHQVMQSGETIRVENHLLRLSRTGKEIPVENSVSPIKDEKGNIRGCLIVFRDVTGKKEKQEKIQYLSYHDELTGLYNRRFCEEEIRRLDTQRNLPISVVMGDVNGLKLVNDTFGHEKGDQFLMKASEIIKNACRADDIIVRWGGDEFVILLPKTGIKEVEEIIHRIKRISEREEVHSVSLSVSFGWGVKETPEQSLQQVMREAEELMYKNKTIDSENERGRMVNTILRSLHEKNSMEEQHSIRVSGTAQLIGSAIGLSSAEISRLKAIGLIHDIGKIAFNDHLLTKAERYGDHDIRMIRRHPEIGYRILSSSFEMRELADDVLFHHEWYDGSGYPKGLKGENIPLFSRIIAIADAYDAMTEYRPYKNKISVEEAMDEILKLTGIQFDPEAARVFVNEILRKKVHPKGKR